MKEIRAFAAVLQALESSSKACLRLCTAEVRGSNPLGSTLKSCRFAGKMSNYGERPEILPALSTPVVHQRSYDDKSSIVHWQCGVVDSASIFPRFPAKLRRRTIQA